jgi:hypothetical protein
MGLNLRVQGESADGPFTFIASIGDVSVEFLNQGNPQVPLVGQAAVAQQVTLISQTGPQGNPGIQGAGGGGGISGGALVAPSFDGVYASDVTTESVMDESLGNFTPGGATLTVHLTCYGKVPSGGTGTVAIRVGGTDEGIDGVVVVSAAISSVSSYQTITTSATFSNPGGTQPVKLTLQSSATGDDVIVKGVEVSITS